MAPRPGSIVSSALVHLYQSTNWGRIVPGIKSAICHQKTHVNNTQHCSKYNWHLQFFSFSEQGTKPNNESFKPTNITVECSSYVVRCLASILNYFAQWLDGFCSYFAAKAQQFNNYFGCENIYKLLIFTEDPWYFTEVDNCLCSHYSCKCV